MATKKTDINLDPVTSPAEEEVETVIPATPPVETTEADIRMQRYKRVRRIASEIFARDWDMPATLGRLGFGYKEDK